MSAMPLALLLATAAATAVGAAALHSVHGLRKQISALRAELVVSRTQHAAARTATVPAARSGASADDATPDTSTIRAAVAEA
ncbi:hypothetical protein P8605_40960, partial [Streptomyces sp. T-3]|nr:hypothetical protein [Streptomyces sp. T-3]